MIRQTLIFSFLILMLFFSCKEGNKSTVQNKKSTIQIPKGDSLGFNILHQISNKIVDSTDLESISIGIFKKGRFYYAHSGELEKGTKVPPSNKTIYPIGSVSKTFAGLLVVHAEDEGKLTLEDDIRKYFKGDYSNLEYAKQPIRIRHLINHTSGFRRSLPIELDSLNNLEETEIIMKEMAKLVGEYSQSDFLRDLKKLNIDTIPGTKYSYSNVAINMVLASILERVYNRSYESILKEKIWDKFGMNNTRITLKETEKEYYTIGYKNGVLAENPNVKLDRNIKTTVPDFVKYIKHQLDSTNAIIVKSHSPMFKIGRKDYTSYLWYVTPNDKENGTYWGHHGGSYGANCWTFIMPKFDFGIIALTNQNDNNSSSDILKAINLVLEEEYFIEEN